MRSYVSRQTQRKGGEKGVCNDECKTAYRLLWGCPAYSDCRSDFVVGTGEYNFFAA